MRAPELSGRKPGMPPVRVIAITGGKGGVGKTSVAVNLSLSLVEQGQRVLLLDTDLGMANADVLLGLTPSFTLFDVVSGRCSIEETLIEGPHGLLVLPAASGRSRMAELKPTEHVGLIHACSAIDRPLDTLIVDTAAGISDSVLTFSQAAQEVLIVVCNEPASMTDAYALVKVLSQERGVKRVRVLANMIRSDKEGLEILAKLSRVTERFLDVVMDFAGAIPHDEWLRRAIQRRQAVVDAFPASASSQAFRELASQVMRWDFPSAPRGGVEFFVERLLDSGEAA
ncbi:MAG: MinD/ParA family protein [Pseudomonadota bacterium]